MKIHPSADVQTINIGPDTEVWQYSIILPGAKIGNHCNINAHCFIENDVSVGNNVTLKCGVYIWDGINIEDDVFIGPNATFINDKNPRSKIYPSKHIGVYVERGASIGANSTIMSNIRIGKYAMIGAGSVVTKNVPNNTIWVGNPAKQVGYICDCGHKLNENHFCSICETQYKLVKDLLLKMF